MALLADTIACLLWKNRQFFFAGIIFLVFPSCKENQVKEKERLPYYNTADFDAEWIKEEDASYSKIHTIDTFSLANQLGYTITKDSLDGYIYVANFFFTSCPGICPKMVTNLQTLQTNFAHQQQIKLVSFSVMPWADSVTRLREYGEVNNINPFKWHLLTGSKEKIYDLARKSYFAEKGLGLQKNNSEFLHTESMLLIDKKGRIRGIYNATQKVDIERVSDDIKVLIVE
jgi:protein SCO1